MTDTKLVVLAVDDTPSNLDLLHGALNEDYKVKVATNGEKALELAVKEPRPDIILLDVMMPGMSGHDVCRVLKQNPETTPIPVVFVTAMSDTKDEMLGLALGAVDYITKPFNLDIVKARVKTHLAQFEKTRDLIRENRELRDTKGRTFTDFDETDLFSLISAGEGHSVEFKSTLRWNLHADRSDKGIENACLKTVAGYLNTDGGTLLVGVDDDGEVVGLGKDHFPNEDKFLLHWVNLVKSYIGAEFMPYMRSIIEDVGNKRVLVVECLPSTKPAFVTRDNEESFFVRMTNTTQALKASESVAYIGEHFSERREPQAREPLQPARHGAEDGTLAGWMGELMKRHVIRTAAIYFSIAWALTASGIMIARTMRAPEWVGQALVIAFVAGFPAIVLMSWVYDIRATDKKRPASSLNRKRTYWLVAALVLLSAVIITLYSLYG